MAPSSPPCQPAPGQGRTRTRLAALEGLAAAGDQGPSWPGAGARSRPATRGGAGEPSTGCAPGIRDARPGGGCIALDRSGRPGRAEARFHRRGAGRCPRLAPGPTRPMPPPGPRTERWPRSPRGLAAAPGSGALLFAQAGLGRRPAISTGAIAAYEALMPRTAAPGGGEQPGEPARDLSRRSGEPRSRLHHRPAAARSDMPFFRDTYGWILHRRGDDIQALTYLAPA